MLLTNNLTNICSEISKIRMNLRIFYTCNMKSSRKLKNWKNVYVLYIVDQDHQGSVVVVEHSRDSLRHLVNVKSKTYGLQHRKCRNTLFREREEEIVVQN